MQSVLAPPFGQRTSVSAVSAFGDDEEFEERRVCRSIIKDLGFYCRLNIDISLKLLNAAFSERIEQRRIVAEGGISADQRQLWYVFQIANAMSILCRLNDIRWILCTLGAILKDSDHSIGMQLDGMYKGGRYTPTNMNEFFVQCLQQSDTFNAPLNADPVVVACGMVVYWTAILLRLMEGEGSSSAILDQSVIRQSLKCLGVVIHFLTTLSDFSEHTSAVVVPSLSTDEQPSVMLIEFVVQLCFAVFREYLSNKL